ncbi:Fmp45p [Apiospora kogelbergensis]|uniref:Fmp45p n=1 Tax=Apiospora kogelbergensis TaxID=1337665 RepID=A0AAW0RBV1_9PEZI
MALSHAGLGLTSLILLAASIVLMLFVILSGVTNVTPFNRTYFLSAATDGITGARPRTQWTYFYMCRPGNVDCGGAWPAPPFGWAWDANPTGAPSSLVGSHGNHTTSSYFFYMWRFGWVFYLMTLFFSVLAFFTGFLACCGRLGSALAGLSTLVALFFYSIAVSLMTATFVKARNAFAADGRDASLGRYAFGFSWGAWACLFLSMLLFFLGTRAGKDKAPAGPSTGGGWGRSRFGRKRSVRSRRSYDMGSRRVKDDYS